MTRYPLVMRKIGFLESKQQQGQLFSDWASRLRALGDEASLHDLTTEKIYIMHYLTGVSEEKLREKFLKEAEPTIEALDQITQHKVAASSIRSMGGRIDARKVVPTLNRSQKRIPSTRDLIGRCTHCSDDNHPLSGCPQKSSTCHGCKTTGHLLRVCQKAQLGKAKPGKFPPER